MALVLEEEDAMFTGDNVLGHGTAVFEDLPTYLKSLEKMRATFRGRAYPGHGPVIEDGPSKILEYIKHRKEREDQVIQVLKSSKSSPDADVQAGEANEWTSMEIVKIIYKDVPETLHLPANGGVLQVLRKLEEEEKVIQDSATEKWRIRDRAASESCTIERCWGLVSQRFAVNILANLPSDSWFRNKTEVDDFEMETRRHGRETVRACFR